MPTGSSDDGKLVSPQTERFEIEDRENVVAEEDVILDGLTDQEFFRCRLIVYIVYILSYTCALIEEGTTCFRLLQIEPEKRMETLMYQHRAFGKALEDLAPSKLCKLNVDSRRLHANVPYEIYTEASDDKVIDLKMCKKNIGQMSRLYDNAGNLKLQQMSR